MKCRVEISLKPGVLDAEGNAAAGGLRALGFKVEKVSFTKEYVIEGNFSAGDADEMCRKLLANPIIQDYNIEELKETGASAKEERKPKTPKTKPPTKPSKPAKKAKKPAKKPAKKARKAKKKRR